MACALTEQAGTLFASRQRAAMLYLILAVWMLWSPYAAGSDGRYSNDDELVASWGHGARTRSNSGPGQLVLALASTSGRQLSQVPTTKVPAPAAHMRGLPTPVQAMLKKLKLPLDSISVFVQAVDAKRALLSVNADVARNPASVMKLVTTLAGLDLLGPGYQWHTDIFATAQVRNGKLNGPLYLKGGGDPFLTTERFWKGLRDLRGSGLSDITGGLVLDHSKFQSSGTDAGAFDGQSLRAYNVLPQALLLNFGATTFTFYPDPELKQIRIVTDPPNRRISINNKLRLLAGRCKGKHRRMSMSVEKGLRSPTVHFSGDYPASCGTYSLLRSVLPDSRYVFGVFDALWRQLGGTIADKAMLGMVPIGARRIMRIPSETLSDVIRGMNKHSINVMTRQLLLSIGAEVAGPPGTEAKGRSAINEWIAGLGIDTASLYVDNGSGLSRDGRITARQLGQLLAKAYHSPLMPAFIASMPLAATDGTLKKRFKDRPIAGRLHMKTGLIKHVRAGAGYLWARDGRVYVVVSLHNHRGVHSGVGTKVQDALLKWLYKR